MMKIFNYAWILMCFLIYGCTSKTLDKDIATNDSIQKYLNLAANDSLDFKVRDKYNGRALSFMDLRKNDTIIRYFLSRLSFNYMKTQNKLSLNKIGKIHLNKSISTNDTLNLARYYRYKAGYFKNTFINDSSLYYYIKAEKFYKKTHDKYGLARVYFGKSVVQYLSDDYLGAEYNAKKSYYLFKNSKNYFEIARCLVNLGNICNNLKDYNNAILYHKKALRIIIKYEIASHPKEDLPGMCLNNIGNVYKEKKLYSEAIYYFKCAFKNKKLLSQDPELYAILLNNLGYCYMELKHRDDVSILFVKAGKILDSLNLENESVVSNIYLSEFYIKRFDTLKAQFFAEKALKIAERSKASYYYLTALSNAGSINKKKAPEYIKQYHKKNDSILFKERNAKNQYYKILFETNEINEEKETAVFQKWIICGIGSVIILIIFLLLIITRQKSKQKQLQLFQSQQKANEEIYDLMLSQKGKEEMIRQSEKKRISLELHDGVMNRLASTRLNLNVLSHKRDDQTIQKCLIQVDNIYQIEQEIRSIAHNLSYEIFDNNNVFISLLNDFITTNNELNITDYKLEISEAINWDFISSSIKMNLYRIIQEAIHNINKFAEADKVIISFIRDGNNLCLSVTDNGKGFDVETKKDGIGLKNINQRVENLKGKFVIKSIKGKNTSLNIAIPLV